MARPKPPKGPPVCRVCRLPGGDLVQRGLDGYARKDVVHPECLEDEVRRWARERTALLLERAGYRRPGAAMQAYHGAGASE